MLCYPFEEKRLVKWLAEDGYAIVQPKLNGVRAWWDGERLWSSEMHIISSVPHINKALRHVKTKLDGELYIHGESLQKIRSITGRTVNLHPEHSKVRFYAFDIKHPLVQQSVRIEELSNTLASDPRLYVVPLNPMAIDSVENIGEMLAALIQANFEGMIFRKASGLYEEKRSTSMMKWKPKQSDVYKIVSLIEGAGKYAGTLGALEVIGDDAETFNVGSFAIDDAERDRLWANREKLIGRDVRVRYFELTDAGVPPSGVFEALVE